MLEDETETAALECSNCFVVELEEKNGRTKTSRTLQKKALSLLFWASIQRSEGELSEAPSKMWRSIRPPSALENATMDSKEWTIGDLAIVFHRSARGGC